jgi:hypothetical protein
MARHAAIDWIPFQWEKAAQTEVPLMEARYVSHLIDAISFGSFPECVGEKS